MQASALQPDLSPDALALAEADLFYAAPSGTLGGVYRPNSAADLGAILAALPSDRAVVVRGGGLSYTAGVVPAVPAVAIDMTGIDHIEINPDDMWVRVGAGCSWQRLADALAPHKLRVPIAAPTSGLHSTIGGAISQGLPGTMEAVLGLTVALPDGGFLTTGSASLAGRGPFNRHAGPDLTGLFIGDCGTLGIKTEVVLRLVRAPQTDFASFQFDDPLALVASMVDLQRDLGVSSMGIDPVRTATALKALEAAEAARGVLGAVREGGSLAGRMRALLDMGRFGVAALTQGRAQTGVQAGSWSLHVTAEHPTADGARALIRAAKSRVRAGKPVAPGIPRAARARPFSVRGALGPDAERWVPVHGILPLSKAVPAMAALQSYAAANQSRMTDAGVFMAWLTSSRHGAVLFEPMLYWRDGLTPVHRRYMDERLVTAADARVAPDGTPALIVGLRAGLCRVMDDHGATHLQLGRYYDHAALLEPGALALLKSLKQVLDPQARMNPGALGLAPRGAA